MKTRSIRVTGWIISGLLLTSLCPAWAQEETPEPSQDISVPSHWSPYDAPSSYPEGTQLHIIVRGDTLWDLANQYLANPFLWPQVWEENRYITNPNLIYPGDPLAIPQVDVVRAPGEEPGAPGAPGEPGGRPGEPGRPGEAGVPGQPGGPMGPSLIPAYEEIGIQCAGYVADKENEDLKILGSEEGGLKVAHATGDIVYLNRGLDYGLSPGDRFYTQRRVEKVDHPARFGSAGWLIQRSGWLTVMAVQEQTATAEITQACLDVFIGDYLIPFEQVPVPLVPVQAPVNRMTPETGRLRGHIVASTDNVVSLGQGLLIGIDLGEEDGVIPGNIFTIFRYLYNNVQRKVLGEAVVLTVQQKTATAKISLSYDVIVEGDEIELK